MKIHDILDERNILPIRSELVKAKGQSGYQSEILQNIFKKIAPRISVLGTGTFGLAINLPNTPYICKLWINDPGYREFVNFCQAHSSVHLPKFQDAGQLRSMRKSLNEEYYSTIKLGDRVIEFSIVERLTKIPYTEWSSTGHLLKYRAWMCKIDMMNVYMKDHDTNEVIDDLANARGSEDVMEKYNIETRQQLLDHWDEIESSLGGIEPSWKSITTELMKFRSQREATLSFDLYNENFMMRGNTLVITDPFFVKKENRV